jgi:hypothetical protein
MVSGVTWSMSPCMSHSKPSRMPNNLDSFELAADRRRRDHAVDAGAGPPHDENRESFGLGSRLRHRYCAALSHACRVRFAEPAYIHVRSHAGFASRDPGPRTKGGCREADPPHTPRNGPTNKLNRKLMVYRCSQTKSG